jgi:hypothetical protein
MEYLVAKSYHLQVIADFQLVLLQFDIIYYSISGFPDANSETSTEPLVAKYHAGTRELELSRRSSRQRYGHRGIHKYHCPNKLIEPSHLGWVISFPQNIMSASQIPTPPRPQSSD